MHGRGICQQRTLGVSHIIDGDDQQIEEIAAEDVAHGHIQGADPQGGQGDGHLGKRGGHRHEQGADKGLPPLHLRGHVLSRHGQSKANQHHNRGSHDITPNGLAKSDMPVANRDFARVLLERLTFILKHRINGDSVGQHDQGRGYSHVANRQLAELMVEQDVEPNQPQQHDAEAGSEDVPLTHPGEHRCFPVQKIQKHEQDQVEYTTTDRIAQGDIG